MDVLKGRKKKIEYRDRNMNADADNDEERWWSSLVVVEVAVEVLVVITKLVNQLSISRRRSVGSKGRQ